MIAMIQRRLVQTVVERFQETPVLLLEGARGVGKSTLLAEMAAATPGARVFNLDDVSTQAAAQQNLSLLTHEGLPVIVDEYQRLPQVLQSIKARLNVETRPGMFLLAGSSSYDSLPAGTQALTGRLQRLAVMPLTQAEIDRVSNRFVEAAFEGSIQHTLEPASAGRLDYVDRIVRGGMPLALSQPTPVSRNRWFAAHVEQSLRRDAGQLRQLGRTAALPKLLTRAVAQTGGLLNVAKMGEMLGVSWATASSYLELLEALFLISALPSWGFTVSSRSVEAPKIHVVDSGMGAHLLRLNRPKLERGEPSALTEFGHLLESFAVQEIVRHTTWMDDPVSAGHWRTRDGDEVDLVLERHDGAVLAFEIKAGDHVDSRQLSGLRKLRDRVGDSFVGGIAFHLGRHGYQVEDRIHSLPLERLWV